MAQQCKNLTVEHLEIEAFDGFEVAGVGLFEVLDPQIVALSLKTLAHSRWFFIIFDFHLLALKFVIDLSFMVSSFILVDLVTARLAAAATPVARHAEEEGAETLSKA